jgi:hypothetical protein
MESRSDVGLYERGRYNNAGRNPKPAITEDASGKVRVRASRRQAGCRGKEGRAAAHTGDSLRSLEILRLEAKVGN